MSIKKKLPLIFCFIVFIILLINNAFHYERSKQQLLHYNNEEIEMISKSISFHIETTKAGTLFVENILGRELRVASVAIREALPSDYRQITNGQLKSLAKNVGVSHITLLAQTKGDIIGVRSTDPDEINMSTNDWGYWYDAFQQLFARKPVTVKKGLSLPNYWSGPVEIASSNPDHIDKWGYYYDGTTNYIINPYFRDKEVLGFEQKFGPEKIIKDFTKEEGVLELTVFNPENFGKKKKTVNLNGNTYTRISEEPYWYGSYDFKNYKKDSLFIKKALKTKTVQSYSQNLNHKSVMKTFVPVQTKNQTAYVIGLVYNYALIQNALNHELNVHILLSIAIMILVLLISLIFSRSITQPIGYIVDQVNEIAKGKYGKTLSLNRKDELGLLTENVNALSTHLKNYVSDLKKSKELIEYQAYHDPLTGLLNRRYFQEKLKPIMEEADKNNSTVAILFIDLDRFKQVNDTFGHSKGDEILKIAADRIKKCIPVWNPIITRQGGDEFLIILTNLDFNAITSTAEKIIGTLRRTSFSIDGNEVYLGASCGISLYPIHTTDLDNLVIFADMAMYAAKKLGGNRAVVYRKEFSKAGQERPKLESRLRKAIEARKLEVYYQPKVNLQLNTTLGVEALLRWNDEELGFVSPEIFISIAEETGLIQPLWEFVMGEACTQVSNWNQKRPEPLCLSVNFSARQFQEPCTMVKQVKDILLETKLGPSNFEIEITESILLNNSSDIIEALRALQEFGIRISIDDFGTGYSSLSYLRDLPIDTLKIDKSFIQNITEDLANTEIPEAIINLARSLHLDVIAEGVEQEYQKEFLISKSCYNMQGFLFSKPISKDDFDNYLFKI